MMMASRSTTECCACLGLSFSVGSKTVHLSKPHLPSFIDDIELKGLRIGEASMDLKIRRMANGLTVEALDSRGQSHVELND